MLKKILARVGDAVLNQIDVLPSEAAALYTRLQATTGYPLRRTDRPQIVALIGLVGSGKSTFAKSLAPHLGAVIIEGDVIRAALRALGIPGIDSSNNVRIIAEHLMLDALRSGSNVIMDSDFVSAAKRVTLLAKARNANASVHFVRLICDLDVLIGRIMSTSEEALAGTIFASADSQWHGTGKPNAVKLREAIRRLPLHYFWSARSGGHWVPRPVLAPALLTIKMHNADQTCAATLLVCATLKLA